MKLGDKIKQLREEKGWTQKELAEKLGLAKSTVSLYEINKREPNNETLTDIARLFEASFDVLLDNVSFNQEPKIVLYGSDGHLVDISSLSKRDQKIILDLAESFKNERG